MRKAIKAMLGFPRCSTIPGKFCFSNQKEATISIATLKTLDVTRDGNIKVRYETKFDGNRTSCAMADLSVTSM